MDTLAFARENYPHMPVVGVARSRLRDCGGRGGRDCDCRCCEEDLTLDERRALLEERDRREERPGAFTGSKEDS